MRCVRICLLIAQAALLAGCFPTIYSPEPLGEQTTLIPGEWNGRWLMPTVNAGKHTVVTFSVVDANKGVVSIQHGCEQPPSPDGEVMMQLRFMADPKIPTELRPPRGFQLGWYFPTEVRRDTRGDFVPSQSTVQPFYYSHFFYRPLADQLVWYPIAVDGVASLIKQGALPGQVQGPTTILGHLQPEHYTLLLSEDHPLLHWQAGDAFSTPFYLLRLPPELDTCTKKEAVK